MIHPSPSLTTFAFWSSEVSRPLLDLDPYSVTEPLGMFPLFPKRTDVVAPVFVLCFGDLFVGVVFPSCWRQANVTPILEGPLSTSVANYRPISITSLLSKVFERLVSARLGRYIELSGVLPTTQFAYRRGLGTCDALLYVSHTLQSALESGQQARIVQIHFSSAFDTVNHEGTLYKLFCLFLEWFLRQGGCLAC